MAYRANAPGVTAGVASVLLVSPFALLRISVIDSLIANMYGLDLELLPAKHRQIVQSQGREDVYDTCPNTFTLRIYSFRGELLSPLPSLAPKN